MGKLYEGRPSKLFKDPKTQETILKAIEQGNYFVTACEAAGVKYPMFRYWMRKGEQAKSGKYKEFVDKVHQARAVAEQKCVKNWVSQIPSDWRAARDFLARRYPERWSAHDKVRQEVTGKDGGPIQVEDAREKLMAKITDIASRKEEKSDTSESDG